MHCSVKPCLPLFYFLAASLCGWLWLGGVQRTIANSEASTVNFSCAAVVEIPQTECRALVALYNSANGPGWLYQGGWLVTNMPCTWYGVTCVAGRVEVLALPDNGLSGMLPVEIGLLTRLRSLDLADNPPQVVTGAQTASPGAASVQPALEELRTLQALSLADELARQRYALALPRFLSATHGLSLTASTALLALGPPPRTVTETLDLFRQQQLGQATDMSVTPLAAALAIEPQTVTRTIDASGENNLSGPLPASLGNLRQLTRLNLFGNALTGVIPPEIGLLTNVTFLDLGGNSFTGAIPGQLAALTNLQIFGLCGNQLTGAIPSQLGTLANLRILFLCYNQLSGPIPPQLGPLANLQYLRLDVNRLSGALPVELGNLTSLLQLQLELNQLSGPIPPQLGNLNNLQLLTVHSNRLTGSIPPALGNLRQLLLLNLGYNQLSGPIPAELGQLTNLVWLSLISNQLSGAIPPELGQLSNLRLLSLSGNQLSGAIPPQLGALTSMTTLSLSDNRLSGPIPPELGNLAQLTTLSLMINQLSGPIPPELGQLANLEELYLLTNQLSAPLPPQLGNLQKLKLLGLFNNQLSGAIPPQLGQLVALEGLYLDVNQFVGPIPPELGTLPHLAFLDLSNNQLSGAIPPELGKLSNLTKLNLGSNALSGAIPPALGKLSQLEVLFLAGNRLSGPIPPELGNLTNLTELWLGLNQLSGEIPPALGNLAKLWLLGLGTNQLTGAIPAELGNLRQLRWLVLSNNRLRGEIPPALGNLHNLTVLWLFANQLSGPLPDLHNLTQLAHLNISNNLLRGSLPAWIGQLPALRYLSLNTNQLSGPLPASLGDLYFLVELRLQSNQFDGAIPTELGNLANLTQLSLAGNRLDGAIPAALGNLTNLVHLNLAANALTDAIPPSLRQLSRLATLDLGYNQLTANDPALVAFLSEKQPAWATTQTLTPTRVQALPQRSDAIALTWTPPAYTGDGGYYAVEIATAATGPFTMQGKTVDKSSPGYTAEGLSANTTYYFRARTYTPVHTYQINELWSDYTPVVSATTSGQVARGDAQETDDSCTQARAMVANGATVLHTFHRPGDMDWVRFDVMAGAAYRVDVQIPDGSSADVKLNLYQNCNDSAPTRWDQSFSPGVQFNFTATQDGPLYLELSDINPNAGGDTVAYHLSVRALAGEAQTGAVILLAGRYKYNDPLQPNIHHVTDALYHILRANGYSDEAIYYLATDPSRPGYDAPATAANLHYAIATWARDRVNSARALTLYLIDHGELNKLFLDEPNGERVTPTQLDAWLNDLERNVPGVQVNVLIEACNSGSFLRANGGGLSKPGRVIAASTNSHNLAYASEDGAIFSDYLLTALRQGHHLFSGFWEARLATRRTVSIQDPWLEADGDGIPNELDDAAVAARRTLIAPTGAVTTSLWPPYIAGVQGPTSPDAGTGAIQAEVRDNGAIRRVWAVIYPPGYTPPETSNELTPQNLPTVALTVVNGTFRGDYTNFNQPGLYRVVIHAEDVDGLRARPVVLEVRNDLAGGQNDIGITRLYLPLVRR